MKVENEHRLLEEWTSGNREAFGELFSRYASRLYNFAFRLTGNPEDSRDILQSAALKAFSSGFPGRNGGNFDAWMHRIIFNLFLDIQKAGRRAGRQALLQGVDWSEVESQAVPASAPPSPRAALDEREQGDQVERALEALSPEYRTVVVLRDIEGFSYEEIAQIEQIPLETVRTRLRRARSRLRQLLAPYLEGER